jgi:signal transduction histidine kinase/ligand-binding sensor domain-containing protein
MQMNFFIYLFIISISCSQNLAKKFKRYGLEEGLSQGTIRSITQDPYGFVWFATQDGLNRYDGYNFKIYRYSQTDTNSIISSSVNHIYSNDEMIWASGLNGVSRINIKTNKIDQFKQFYHKGDLVKYKTVNYFYIDKEKRHWASSGNRLFKLNESTKIFECVYDSALITFIFEHKNSVFFGSNIGILELSNDQFVHKAKGLLTDLRAYIERNENEFYFISENKLILFDIQKNTKKIIYDLDDYYKGSNKAIVSSLIYKENKLWIGSSEGLMIYDLIENEVESFQNETYNNQSLSNSSVRSLFEDHSGTVWVGTRNGLNNFSKFRHKFPHYILKDNSENKLLNNHIRAFVQDSKKRIWIGTNQGIHIVSADKKNYKNDIKGLKSEKIRSLYLTKNADVLVGTRLGIHVFSKNDRLKAWLLPENNNKNSSSNRIYDIEQAGDENHYYLATYKGLFRLEENQDLRWRVTPVFKQNTKQRLSNEVILSLAAYGKDTLLVGTRAGFNILDLKTKKVSSYFHDPEMNTSLSDNSISDILVDSKKKIWIFTKSGINKFNPDSSIFTRFVGDSEITTSQIYGATEDKTGDLWLSTNSGLIKFNQNASNEDYHFNQFESVYTGYNIDDGLQGNEFNQGAFYKTDDGEMFFGGQNGYNRFYPKEIVRSDFSPNITLTSFKRFNRTVFLDSAFFSYKTLMLNHDDYVFTIEFSAMDYNNQKNVHYMYKLEGFNDKIINLFNKQEITYANISPGKYKLKLYASNADYIWDISKYKELEIIILPPFWLQSWFIALSTIFTLLILYAIYRFRLKAIKKNEQILKDKVNNQTVELILMKNELLKINQIVHVINNETSIDNLLQSLLNEMLNISPIERATAVIYHEEDDLYYYRVFAGWKNGELKGKPLNKKEIFKRHIDESVEVKPELYLRNDFDKKDKTEIMFYSNETMAQLSLVIQEGKTVFGLILLDNVSNKDAFNDENLRFIDALKDHIISAFYKVKLLDDLKRLNDIKNQFLGIAAHDLRNPLSMISGYASLNLEYIRMNQLRTDKLEIDLQMMIKTSDQMSDLLTRLLDITSIESGKTTLNMEMFSLKALVSDTSAFHERMAIKKNIELIIDYKSFEKIPKIAMDRIRISEVIDNLLTNALKYTEPGGMVTMTARTEDDNVLVRVKDTGLGLNKDELKYVFSGTKKLSARPTAGESSTGLGLAIVKKIIDLHSGHVSVESEKGKGSLFIFKLPINDQSSVSSEILL